MTYYDPQEPYQATIRQSPAVPRPMDEDGDPLYTEEDYGLPQDGDAFLPDESGDPFLAPQPYMGEAEAPLFQEGWSEEDDLDFTDDEYLDDEYLDDDLLTDEERAELRRSNWRLIAGLTDFGGVILGTAAILVLMALLMSLLNWLIGDIQQTFTLIETNF